LQRVAGSRLVQPIGRCLDADFAKRRLETTSRDGAWLANRSSLTNAGEQSGNGVVHLHASRYGGHPSPEGKLAWLASRSSFADRAAHLRQGYGGQPSPTFMSEGWWTRRESNP